MILAAGRDSPSLCHARWHKAPIVSEQKAGPAPFASVGPASGVHLNAQSANPLPELLVHPFVCDATASPAEAAGPLREAHGL